MKILTVITFITLAGCSSTGPYHECEILEAMVEDEPNWLNKEMFIEGSNYNFIHSVRMSGNSRQSACISAAGMAAKGKMLDYIKNEVMNSAQFNQIDAESDPVVEQFITTISKGKFHGAYVSEMVPFWQTVCMK